MNPFRRKRNGVPKAISKYFERLLYKKKCYAFTNYLLYFINIAIISAFFTEIFNANIQKKNVLEYITIY